MSVAIKFPTTYDELAETGSSHRSFPASWEEFLDLLEVAEYRLEYDENRIITMGYASLIHELLVAKLITLMSLSFDGDNYYVFGSGRPVHIEDKKVYLPDLQVFKEKPKLIEYRKGMDAHVNPWLIVEIMSDSTENRDWAEKLPNYKKIPTVEYILYVQQHTAYISLFKRNSTGKFWENYDFDSLDQSIEIEGKSIVLKDIYQTILKD